MWCTQPGSVGGARRVGHALLVREHGDEPPVARVEVQVALVLVVEVRLLEHERHPEHALPEVDRRPPVGADERDVVDALALELPHLRSTSFELVLAALEAPPRHQLDLRGDDEHGCGCLSRIASASESSALGAAGELDRDRQRRLLLHAGRLRADEDVRR